MNARLSPARRWLGLTAALLFLASTALAQSVSYRVTNSWGSVHAELTR